MGEPRDQNRFLLRMPEGMRDRIRAQAEANGRSMNAELVQLLEDYYPESPPEDRLLDELEMVRQLAKSGRDLGWRAHLLSLLQEINELLTKQNAVQNPRTEARELAKPDTPCSD